MRKFIIPLLLTSVMVPSMATARDGNFVDEVRSRAERSQRNGSSESRPQREERSNTESRSEHPARAERTERPARVERTEPTDRVARQPGVERQVERRNPADRVDQAQQAEQAAPVQRVQRTGRVRQAEQAAPNQQVRTGNAVIDGLREQARRGDRDNDGHDGSHSGHNNGGHDWSHNDHDRDHHRWSGNWRNDRRYDWSSYRSRYASLYRLGRYHDPYGWGYRPFSVGFNLSPYYYGSGYWLDDPWMYRLPPAYGPYRWVRYYDDALLVNIYDGTVVDVVRNFFW